MAVFQLQMGDGDISPIDTIAAEYGYFVSTMTACMTV
jgi:hypothetical protein